MNKEEINYVLESLRFKTSIYRDKKKRNLPFNDDEYYSNILIEYIEELHNKIDKAIELNGEIDKSLRMKNTSAYIELEDIIFEQWKMLKDGDVDE